MATLLRRLSDVRHHCRRHRRVRTSTADGVLIVAAGGLGDTVLFALVLPRLLVIAAPNERVTVLLRREAAKMAFLFPPQVTVEAVDFGRLRDDWGYRQQTFDRLYDTRYRLAVSADHLRHPDLDEALIRACDADQSLAMEPRSWPKHDRALGRNRSLYARLFDSGPPRRDKVLRWAAFADWLTGTAAPPPVVRLAEDHLPPPAMLDAPTVLIQPFSAVAAKHSPVALYERIIESLPSGFRVRIAGAPNDLDRHPEYRVLLERPNVVFDGAAFEALVPTLRACALVISVDTAAMHLAVAVGAPTLCLASAAYVGEIVPYDPAVTPDNVAFIYYSMPCEGCLGACVLPYEGGMYPCVARLDSEAVVAKVGDMLG